MFVGPRVFVGPKVFGGPRVFVGPRVFIPHPHVFVRPHVFVGVGVVAAPIWWPPAYACLPVSRVCLLAPADVRAPGTVLLVLLPGSAGVLPVREAMLDRLVAGRAPDAAITSTDYFVAAGGKPLAIQAGLLFKASHAALWTACHGVRSHPVPVALVGECFMPVT